MTTLNSTAEGAAPGATTLPVLIRQIRYEGKGINSYELVDSEGRELPPFTSGAHIDVHLAGGNVRQYSLCNDPHDRRRYVIAILKDASGKGGSTTLHETLHVQDIITISRPRNNFELADNARKFILLAGGIGVTPLKSMAHRLERAGVDYELHYCAREPQSAAFKEELEALAHNGHVYFHFDGGDPSRGLDLKSLLRQPGQDTHVYYCGPPGFMKACADAASHWPKGTVHFEHFKAPISAADGAAPSVPSGSFMVVLASSGRQITVGPDESLSDALNKAGVPVETSCQSGLCATCKVRYLTGTVQHNDFILSDEDQTEYLTSCISRATSEVLTLDL